MDSGFASPLLRLRPHYLHHLVWFSVWPVSTGSRRNSICGRPWLKILGQLQVGDLEDQLIGVLTRSGFLEDETFHAMKAEREREFAESSVRLPSHARLRAPRIPRNWARLCGNGWGRAV